MLVYTSITRSYIPKARVLANSLKKIHPDWHFCVILSDVLPSGFDHHQEPFGSIFKLDELGIPNWKSWAFGHSVVELCTAVKGPATSFLMSTFAPNAIMYLDPDICVYGNLEGLCDLLCEHDILLTPHLLDPEYENAAIIDNEILSALKHGVYNLGFFAARTNGQGPQFMRWWGDRLLQYCIADIRNGLFTDQRWCDLAPAFFDRLHIVRDRGYNVATWNVAHRRIKRGPDGTIYAGNVPLRFYHFTGYDSGDGMGMLQRYASDQPDAIELWQDYGRNLTEAGNKRPEFAAWEYGHFSDGTPIPGDMRRLYRSRPDLQLAFPDPFRVEGLDCYKAWWAAEKMAGRIKDADFSQLPSWHWLPKVLHTSI